MASLSPQCAIVITPSDVPPGSAPYPLSRRQFLAGFYITTREERLNLRLNGLFEGSRTLRPTTYPAGQDKPGTYQEYRTRVRHEVYPDEGFAEGFGDREFYHQCNPKDTRSAVETPSQTDSFAPEAVSESTPRHTQQHKISTVSGFSGSSVNKPYYPSTDFAFDHSGDMPQTRGRVASSPTDIPTALRNMDDLRTPDDKDFARTCDKGKAILGTAGGFAGIKKLVTAICQKFPKERVSSTPTIGSILRGPSTSSYDTTPVPHTSSLIRRSNNVSTENDLSVGAPKRDYSSVFVDRLILQSSKSVKFDVEATFGLKLATHVRTFPLIVEMDNIASDVDLNIPYALVVGHQYMLVMSESVARVLADLYLAVQAGTHPNVRLDQAVVFAGISKSFVITMDMPIIIPDPICMNFELIHEEVAQAHCLHDENMLAKLVSKHAAESHKHGWDFGRLPPTVISRFNLSYPVYGAGRSIAVAATYKGKKGPLRPIAKEAGGEVEPQTISATWALKQNWETLEYNHRNLDRTG
ncbi:hypothetical protein BGZ63DRAFT_399797 [Mariannaea sp. PMI_226]|nr:hypothetical protein BGZ63DRAFT_399797 [Mariannaea sp. PMI_226]